MGDLKYDDIRNKMYDDSELYLWVSIGSGFFVLFMTVLSIFYREGWFLFLTGIFVLFQPIIRNFLQDKSYDFWFKGEKIRRAILYLDSFDEKMSVILKREIKSWVIDKDKKISKAPFNPPYFSSEREPGPKRLMDNLAESAYFTKSVAQYTAEKLRYVLVSSFLLLLLFLYLDTSLRLGIEVNEVILIISFYLFSDDLLRITNQYSNLAKDAGLIHDKACDLQAKRSLTERESLLLSEEYSMILSSSVPIPAKVYFKLKDKLNIIFNQDGGSNG